MKMLKIRSDLTSSDQLDAAPSRSGFWAVLDVFSREFKKLDAIFIVTVAMPTLCAILYFGIFASDVYVSASEFIVKRPNKPTPVGLGVFLNGLGFSTADDEMFAVREYVESRDALSLLNKDDRFKNAYSAKSISAFDRFNSFGLYGGFENLYKYYLGKVDVVRDSSTSISTLSVRAYTPEDARRFNEQLLEMAEATVNRLNERGQHDLVRYARTDFEKAKIEAQSAAIALARYRDRSRIIDPAQQAEVQIQMISKLQDRLIESRARLQQLRAFTPKNPQIEVLEQDVSGLAAEIDRQLNVVAGGSHSLSSGAVEFQRLTLESEFADKQLGAAMAALQQARSDELRQQAYVERIVQPNLPDSALEPKRLRGIFTTLMLGLVAWGIAKMLLAGLMEHRD